MAMIHLIPCDDPFPLDAVATEISKSSNFHFSWQFYQCKDVDLQSQARVRQALEMIIATPELHNFLLESFPRTCHQSFEMERLHEHCRLDDTTDQLENILARAAGDHLGAYSQPLREATVAERERIQHLLGSIGEYRAYELLPGNTFGCAICANYDNHLFSNWFFGVAWDWCLVAVWPHRDLLWVGCLTDTD
jgi:hypothetical protein